MHSGGGEKVSAWTVLVNEAIAGGVTLFVLWMTTRWVKETIAPMIEDTQNAKAAQKAIVDRLIKAGISPEKLQGLTQWEVAIAQELVFPEDIEGGMHTIGGLENEKQVLYDDILIPLTRPDLFRGNALLTPPRGILLYGPPGTGKTSLAKALAKQGSVSFMCVSPSSLLSKWVGDTQHLTRAIFSLAARIEPCLIFLDEIDALFRERSAGDHEVYRDMKAEFMQLWDGLFTTNDCRIIVVGCTNRPWDVDPAIQRRLPRSIKVDLPNVSQRVKILQTILRSTQLDRSMDLLHVAKQAPGYSGSDLKELCRCALMIPMKEKLQQESKSVADSASGASLRPLTTEDMLEAVRNIRPTTAQSSEYRNELMKQGTGGAYTTDLSTSEDQMRNDLRDFLLGTLAMGQGMGKNLPKD